MRSSDTDTIALLFGIILLYGAWSHWILIFKAVVIILLAIAGIVLAKFIPYLARSVLQNRQKACSLGSIDQMSGLEFEYCVGQLLKGQGFTHLVFTERYDYGVDIVAEKDGVRWGIQVKRYSSLVKASAVRQVVATLKQYNCGRGMVISNNYFSRVAAELARSNDCVLIDRSKLISWVA